MMSDLIFRLCIAALLVTKTAIRFWHRRMITLYRPILDESLAITALRIALIGTRTLILAIYIITPDWIDWGHMNISTTWRSLGVFIGLLSIVLQAWTYMSLNSGFIGKDHRTMQHVLVMRGPYRLIRHPMYTGLYLFAIGAMMVSSNWFVGVTWLVGITIFVMFRMHREEEKLAQDFGERYSLYRKKTAAFVPYLFSWFVLWASFASMGSERVSGPA
jgi:protein-S-isoprenylcysteine O-methyltransferase Ste14